MLLSSSPSAATPRFTSPPPPLPLSAPRRDPGPLLLRPVPPLAALRVRGHRARPAVGGVREAGRFSGAAWYSRHRARSDGGGNAVR